MKNKKQSSYVDIDIQSHSILLFVYVHSFLQRHHIQKPSPLLLFMHSPADSKCLWRGMSSTESSSSQTPHFLLPLEKEREGEEKADENKGDKRGAREMNGRKKKVAQAPVAFI